MKLLKWGFIGCGEVTEKKSGPAFNEVEGSEVLAVMSRNEKKARSYAERHHIAKWYTDAQELIDDPDINAIYIATPPSSHATFAIMAMRAGKPVYVEKPLAANYDDCARINRISEQTGVPCFVAYYRRYLPYFQKVKDIIKQGTTSPYSLYNESIASFTTGDLYDHHDADGFITLFGLPLKVRAMKMAEVKAAQKEN